MKNKENDYIIESLNKIWKAIIFIGVLLAINTIILVINTSGTKDVTKDEDSSSEVVSKDYDVSKFDEISANELLKSTAGKNTLVYIGRETCGWCVEFMPVLNKAIDDYKLDAKYIDIAKIIDYNSNVISDQESYDLMMSLKTAKGLETYMDDDFGATPMLIIVKDGKIVAGQTGYTEAEPLNSFLEENGFKK